MPRALASLSLSFGLISIPVRIYNAIEPAPGPRFRLLAPDGARIRQQYVRGRDLAAPIEDAWPEAESGRAPETAPVPGPHEAASARPTASRAAVAPPAAAGGARTTPSSVQPRTASPLQKSASREAMHPAPSDHEAPQDIAGPPPAGRAPAPAVARDRLLKGYEFEKGRFVTFTPEELGALATPRRDTIDILAFVPAHAVDPLYYDKGYFLAPGPRGARPYALLLEALRRSGHSAIATWAWRGRESIAEIRARPGALTLQQLRYADEVRAAEDLHLVLASVDQAELALALELVKANAELRYDPARFVNEAQTRLRAAIERKVAGKRVIEPEPVPVAGAQVIDLMQALRASLGRGLGRDAPAQTRSGGKGAKRAAGRSDGPAAATLAAPAAPRRRTRA
jgi:DNA end-binding protein Ku